MVSTVTSQQEGRRFDSHTRGLCLWRLQVLPVSVLARCRSFLPHSKEMNITGSSKLSVDVSVSVSTWSYDKLASESPKDSAPLLLSAQNTHV